MPFLDHLGGPGASQARRPRRQPKARVAHAANRCPSCPLKGRRLGLPMPSRCRHQGGLPSRHVFAPTALALGLAAPWSGSRAAPERAATPHPSRRPGRVQADRGDNQDPVGRSRPRPRLGAAAHADWPEPAAPAPGSRCTCRRGRSGLTRGRARAWEAVGLVPRPWQGGRRPCAGAAWSYTVSPIT
jgi:hypothetical protein